jgi:hypothetical protein
MEYNNYLIKDEKVARTPDKLNLLELGLAGSIIVLVNSLTLMESFRGYFS